MAPFQEMLEHMCRRPEMYVGERRFRTLAAFIDGFSLGLSEANPNPDTPVALAGFRPWLAEKFYKSDALPRNMVWWGYIESLYPDDEERFTQLPVLYEEFLSHGRRTIAAQQSAAADATAALC